MDKVYIFGHQKPDTDSVTASISLAYLKNKLGYNAEARVLGDINEETKFALDYFNVDAPRYLNDVRLQIKDVTYHKGLFVNYKTTMRETYNYILENNVTGVPIVDDNNTCLGIITVKDIAKNLILGDFTKLDSTYENILKVLSGEVITKYNEEIDGHVIVASYKSETFFHDIVLTNNDIVIAGDREQIHKHAINNKVRLLIVTDNSNISNENLVLAKENNVNIIRTSLDAFHTSRLITQANEINILRTRDLVTFKETDYYDDFLSITKKYRHNNYPVVDNNGKCLGLIRVTDVNDKNKKKVILVDHQEFEQSVPGIEEAQVIEIVDHHKISNISTKMPINFRNMAVGSTNTIIYEMYREAGIEIPNNIAGIMLAGILSDTLILQSPTTTIVDKEAVERLSERLSINYVRFALDMFKKGTSLKGLSKEEIITRDFKLFDSNGRKFGIGQIITLDVESIKDDLDLFLEELNNVRDKMNIEFASLFITDIVRNGSYVIYTENMKDILERGYKVKDFKELTFLQDVVSRKKQIVPVILNEIDN